MEISFKTTKMQKTCKSEKASTREWGPIGGAKIRQRLAELRAAITLADMSTVRAANCHPLNGDRTGEFAVNLKHPFRLVFDIANKPIPKKENGEIDLPKVTAVRIIEVVDYHGE